MAFNSSGVIKARSTICKDCEGLSFPLLIEPDMTVRLPSAFDRVSADELFGRKGYLMSRNIERDVQMKSWTEDGEAALIAITDALKQHRVTKRYETEKHIGIGRAEVNAETGEVYEEQYIGAELTDLMQQMGFSDISSKCEYYSSAMRCPERFSVLTAAKKKK